MFAKTVAVLVMSSLAAALTALAAAAADDKGPLVQLAARCPAIILRQHKDQRIALREEKFGKEETVQVYLSLTDEPHPFTFSLGWFTPQADDKEWSCTDELGQQLPLPGERPAKIDKVDMHEIRGFDLISAGKPHQALKEFAEAVHDPQSNPRFYNNLGACLAAVGQVENAEKQLELAIKMKPDFTLAMANKAWLELAVGKTDLSLADSRNALQMDPDLRPARFAAIKAQINLALFDGALKVSEDTVKRWPGDPQAILMSGEALAAKGDLKSARARYQKALLLLPNDPQVLLKLAQVSQVLGDLDDALKRARQATVTAPDFAAGHLALGRYLEMNREERAAQVQFERALELEPPMSTKEAIYGPMLRVLITMNKLDEADKLSRKWVSANQESADCHFNRAWIASQLKGPEHVSEAVLEYRKALAMKKDLVQAHYNLALLLVKQGKSTEAASELKAFIQLAPQDPDIPNARKLLAQIAKSSP